MIEGGGVVAAESNAARRLAPSWVVNTLAVLGIIGLSTGALAMDDGWWALIWVGYLVMGTLILRRRPETPSAGSFSPLAWPGQWR